jgi:serine/threonine protein kinase/Flp pilus assembly protein TadD
MTLPSNDAGLSQDAAAEFQEFLRQGDVAAARSLLSRHPALHQQKRLILDLVYEEYCQEAEAGQSPDPERFCARFPAYKSSLRRLVALHSFLHKNQHLIEDKEAIAWPKPGQTFMGFVLERELGRGAFAHVFQAREPALGDRKVAVKISLRGGAEAQTLGPLRHPHVVPVHSVQEDQVSGLTVVCMPYLGRATLEDILDRVLNEPAVPTQARIILDVAKDDLDTQAPGNNHTPPHPILRKGSYIDGVLHLGVKLAEALAFIHKQGVYHRDLKPTNVLLTPDGRPMLLDFNLSVGRQAYAASVVGGTLPYMAPEELLASGPRQLWNQKPFDPRSDVFSLGTILYELLTGAHPFGPIPVNTPDEELRENLLQRQGDGPRPVRQLNSQVDRALAGVLERCLAYEPEHRPQSARELAELLGRSLAWTRRARRWVGAHPRVWVYAAAALLGIGSLAGYFYSTRDPYPLRQLHQGLAAYRRGDYDEAVQCLSRTLKDDPECVDALFHRGLAFVRMNQANLAASDLQRAENLCEDGRELAYMGYFFNRKIGSTTEAIPCYLKAIDRGMATAEVFNNLGFSYTAHHQLQEAQASLDKALVLNPNLQAAFHNRAKVDYARALNPTIDRIPSQGLRDLREAIRLGPRTCELYTDAALLCAVARWRDACWTEATFDYLKKARELGLSRQWQRAPTLFLPMSKDRRFRQLLELPEGSPTGPPTTRLLNPTPEYPD